MKMSSWITVPPEQSYGIAIHNYQEVGEFRIKLTVGECVRIKQECEDWYYGYAGKNESVLGIFPRSFIHVMDPSYKDTACGNIYGNQPHIVSEVTSVLREWGAIWRRLYITHNPHFKTIEHKMYELIRLRSKILSGTLPVDELKEVKKLVTCNIDVGNKLLGLDMVVRDEQGNILNPDNTSVIELYRQHEMATQRILTPSNDFHNSLNQQLASQSHTYTFYLSVRNFMSKFTEDVELLFTLYDQKQSKPFSENFVVRWTRDMFLSDAEKYYNFRALFIDLGIRDLNREKVYLVCYVIKSGSTEAELNNKNNKNGDGFYFVRRPLAVACYNLSPYFKTAIEADEDKRHFLPLLPCEKDTLDNTLKKCFNIKEFPLKDNKSQGIVVNFKLLNGDIKQVREQNPHLVFGNIAIVQKMGFPEVILPGDVRNDLYLTLINGEFSKGTKASDKNIEVVVTVCGEKGVPLQGGIILGSGIEPQTEYRSVVYYHEDKPRWFETFRVGVSIEEFKGCHLKFLFKHRYVAEQKQKIPFLSSKNENKEKNEKPFALSFVRLMQKNGTTLKDEAHDLVVYKVDQKKYESTDISYLELASTRSEVNEGVKCSIPGLTFCNKDYFIIQTNVCSTKLTQNVDLLGLLNWTSDPSHVTNNLSALMKVGGEEVVKFLQDVLDALFNILMCNSETDLHDDMVFDCLLHVIELVLNRKYQHFQPVLDLYIEESFSATLAYNKLIAILKQHVNNVTTNEKDYMLKLMKSLKYIMKFITRSRYLFSQLYEGKGQEQFEITLSDLLETIGNMMCHKTDSTLLVQGACLKYLPSTIPDILVVYNPVKLSIMLMKMINKLPNTRLTKQKMMTIDDIIHSPLFLLPECRAVLLKEILILVKQLLEASDEGILSAEHRRNKSKSVAKIAKVLGASGLDLQPPDENISQLELCIKVLSDIMDLLFKEEAGCTDHDIKNISLIILRTVIQTTIRMDRESPLVGNLASVMISVYRQMKPHHFTMYINHFATKSDLLDFLMEILLVFKDFILRPVYPTDWCEMILLQNNVILKSLRFFSHTIRDLFTELFEYQVWNNFFCCAVSFLTQPALQLERFSQSKRWRILTRYKDMRRTAGYEIRVMWFNLGQNKKRFVPSLVSPFLEMTLIPEEELRKATIPIFFDMMQSEFYSSRDNVMEKKESVIKYNFSEFENEMIAKLDNLVEGGSGDEQYKEMFSTIMMNLCENHTVMKDQGTRFVSTITKLMERLLEYRCILNDESKSNRMICTVNLLNFYNKINRKEMYIRYVNKLCALHLECENYTEAAYTLRLHSKLLSWSDTPLSPLLRSPKYPHCETHRQLKEALYQDMIAYFDKGKMWECAVYVCKELVCQYEEETFDYTQLSHLLKRMSQFYDCIIKQFRPKPEYFRVGYYGRGFPSFLCNKAFVHRGMEYDRWSDFCGRLMNHFPNAELMTKLGPPTNDILESSGQYIQINHVQPVMDERKQKLMNKPINNQILDYHKTNNISKFQFDRPIHRNETEGEEKNEFANMWIERTVLEISTPLPGILKWFPVVSKETYLISPLKNAIETMETINRELRELIISYKNDSSLPLNPLAMKLSGIVNPAVMGGVDNYEKAFFVPEYEEKHPEDVDLINSLKNLIASQIPLLDIGIQIHGQRAPNSLMPLQKQLEEQFQEMKIRIEEKYGKKVSDIKYEAVKFRRRTTTGHSFSHYSNEDRLSQSSVGSSEGRSLRSFVNLTNPFSSTPTLSRNPNHNKASLMSANSLSSSIAMFAAPVLSNSQVSPQKFGTISSLRKREKKEKKRRNRTESKITLEDEVISRDSIVTGSGNSQWYTTPGSDGDSMSVSSFNSSTQMSYAFDYNQDTKSLKLTRPDSDIAKTSSRPSSDSSFTQFEPSGMTSPVNRDSFGTNTDSTTTSEDDRVPPPLPAKHREVDYSNLPNDVTDSPSFTPPRNSYTPPLQKVNDESQQDGLKEDESPPTPPPKKPVHRFNHTLV